MARRDSNSSARSDQKGTLKGAQRIFKYMAPYKWRYILGLVFLFLTSLVFLSFTQLTRYLVDSTNLLGGTLDYQIPFEMDMTTIGLVLFGVLLLQAFFSFFRVYLFSYVTEHSLADFRTEAYNRLITLPMVFFTQKSVGELSSRMASDISQIQEVLNTTLAELLRQAMLIVGGLFLLFYTSAKLTFMMLGVVPVIALAAVYFGRYIRSLSRGVQDEVARSTHIVEESVSGIVNVKSFTNESFESDRFRKSVTSIRSYAIRTGVWRGLLASFIILCVFGTIVGVLWYAVHLIDTNELTPGSMIQFMLLAMTIGISIGGMAELYGGLQKGFGAVERVLELIDEDPEDGSLGKSTTDIDIHGHIAFDKVSFTYPNRPEVQVLHDVTFEVNPGQQVAIVGPSGAGKSTITALILRFYQPDSGVFNIDGKPASDYDLKALRKHMAIVPQEVMLFGGTIRQNIAYGRLDATEDEIRDAAEKANALEFINKFPDGFETLVGERGVQLSGGQRQRIAIARAILKDPKILLLDEATSSLDTESERLVQGALEYLMKGRTSIVIAHRLSTIRNADKILVLEDGRLREEGTHDELIALENGIYRNLSSLQLS
ncbi:MAG: ATP-binding cassette domain-containing protein [Flavobacteriales bacterium]|nr:ATP-binding cassette domain-containing protein [Flavobacteriales bacterium]